jgi:hypothetical protein
MFELKSDTGGKIITTILLLGVAYVLYFIAIMKAITYCGSDCNKTRNVITIKIISLIVSIIIPYYILVIIWGFTKMNYFFGAYMLFIVLTELQEHNFIRRPLFQ